MTKIGSNEMKTWCHQQMKIRKCHSGIILKSHHLLMMIIGIMDLPNKKALKAEDLSRKLNNKFKLLRKKVSSLHSNRATYLEVMLIIVRIL